MTVHPPQQALYALVLRLTRAADRAHDSRDNRAAGGLVLIASSPAIRAEHLSKEYRIGASAASLEGTGPRVAVYRTLRESIGEWAGGIVRGRAVSVPQYVAALRDVSFEVDVGSVVGIIGRNGAGKTTLLKVLARITEPTHGTVTIRGRVGSLLEVGTGFHPELTGRENISLSGAILGMRKEEIREHFDEIVAFAEVERFINTPLKRYSSGMYLRLAFAVAAHLQTEIMLVDEVLAVGDLQFRQKCLGEMRAVGRSGRTVIYVSHDMNSIRQLCQRVLWLEGGAIVADGPASEVIARYESQAYGGMQASGGVFRRPLADKQRKAIWFEQVELRNEAEQPSTEFNWGDVLRLVMSFGGSAPIDGFAVEWSIQNERGERISYGSANPQQNVYFDRQDRVVECVIGPLWLTSGRYSFWLAIWVSNQPRWDVWDEVGTFQVVRADPFETGFDASAGQHGSLVMPHSWRTLVRGTHAGESVPVKS